MLGALKELVGLRTVVVLLLVGLAILVLAAFSGGPGGQVVAGLIAILVVILGLAMMFAIWIKRMNEDIDSSRHEIRQDLDAAMEEFDSDE
jgi:uncharacterized membrane protein YqjE